MSAEPVPRISLSPISVSDGEEIIELFNYYVENSDAAFPENPVPVGFFEQIRSLLPHYPTVTAKDTDGIVIGFGMLRPYNPMPGFRQTAVISYFIHPRYTRMGIGSQMLLFLEDNAKENGIISILAEISSRNTGSIRFHEKNGFIH
ncbi:MAG: N-acetyltransferase family protein, partial [Methanospirillum sp.]|uniref:GNAT family N-acetyltransferase n=1 Tax=Methanospirillum sp. TaxID=45200 RepID=UPI00236DDC71